MFAAFREANSPASHLSLSPDEQPLPATRCRKSGASSRPSLEACRGLWVCLAPAAPCRSGASSVLQISGFHLWRLVSKQSASRCCRLHVHHAFFYRAALSLSSSRVHGARRMVKRARKANITLASHRRFIKGLMLAIEVGSTCEPEFVEWSHRSDVCTSTTTERTFMILWWPTIAFAAVEGDCPTAARGWRAWMLNKQCISPDMAWKASADLIITARRNSSITP